MSARPASRDVPWQVWAFAAAAILAIAVGTVARGFLGQDWFFNADNVADSLPLALPFLVAAGVMLGADRWAPGQTWLLAGAWLLALHGLLGVVFELQVASITNDGAISATDPWPVVNGLLDGSSHALGFSALAIGMWRSSSNEWRRVPAWAAFVVAAVTAVTVAGLLATNLAVVAQAQVPTPYVVASVVLYAAFVAAAAALAIAALRATPPTRPFPELLIAAGAAIYGINRGLAWWLSGVLPPDSGLHRLTFTDIADAALLAVAIGFASGALFRPAED